MSDKRKSKAVHFVSEAPKPMGAYPHARKAGNLLFLSGIGPRNPETNEVPVKIEDQCHAVFKNVKSVLEGAGAHWDQLVDITVFLTNIDQDFDAYNRVYAEYFKEHSPCRTTVGVTGLPSPIDIELKCVAVLGT
jgi:2-aminomuconate deaminase